MSAHPITSIEAFRATLGAYRFPRVILSAIELNLFTVMGLRTWSISKLAVVLKVSQRGLEILCRNLAMGGLLGKRGQAFRVTVFAATVLTEVGHSRQTPEALRRGAPRGGRIRSESVADFVGIRTVHQKS